MDQQDKATCTYLMPAEMPRRSQDDYRTELSGRGHSLACGSMGDAPFCRDCRMTYFEIKDYPAIRCADALTARASGALPDRKSDDQWTVDGDGIARNDRARALVGLQTSGLANTGQDDKTLATCIAKFHSGGTVNFTGDLFIPPFPDAPPATARSLPLNALRAPTTQAVGLRLPS
jgi:hypothetical protein